MRIGDGNRPPESIVRTVLSERLSSAATARASMSAAGSALADGVATTRSGRMSADTVGPLVTGRWRDAVGCGYGV